MPLYEYECSSCDDIVEVLVRSGDQRPQCPACQSKKLIRVFSVPATPAVKGAGRLPVTGSGEPCDAPRCCGGGCQF